MTSPAVKALAEGGAFVFRVHLDCRRRQTSGCRFWCPDGQFTRLINALLPPNTLCFATASIAQVVRNTNYPANDSVLNEQLMTPETSLTT